MVRRFLTFDEVMEELAITRSQLYALVRRGDLPALKIGGRGQWRIERVKLEEYIQQAYEDTRRFVTTNPFPGKGDAPDGGGEPAQPEPNLAPDPAPDTSTGAGQPE